MPASWGASGLVGFDSTMRQTLGAIRKKEFEDD
jgi:hypothetical protein